MVAPSEPQSPASGLSDDDISAIQTHSELSRWKPPRSSHLVLIAHDAIVPGVLSCGDDVADLIAAQRPATDVRITSNSDGWNRLLSVEADKFAMVLLGQDVEREYSFVLDQRETAVRRRRGAGARSACLGSSSETLMVRPIPESAARHR